MKARQSRPIDLFHRAKLKGAQGQIHFNGPMALF